MPVLKLSCQALTLGALGQSSASVNMCVCVGVCDCHVLLTWCFVPGMYYTSICSALITNKSLLPI